MQSQLLAPFTLGGGHETGNWSFDYMNSFMWTIAGGSNEIQRNIISERVLKMPRETSVDTNKPFKDVPRNIVSTS